MHQELKLSDSVESKALKPNTNSLNVSNHDMQASRNIFAQSEIGSREPAVLDFGNVADLYGKNHISDVTLLARGNDRLQNSNIEKQNLPLGNDIAKHAQELGEKHPKMWANEGRDGEIRKCNLFADKVFRDMRVPLPWDSAHIPTVHNMLPQLAKSADWEAVYSDKQPSKSYHPEPGDFALWNKTIHTLINGRPASLPLEHCGVIGNDGCINYAGSYEGYAESNFKSMCNSESFAWPTVIYRSMHVRR